MQQFPQHIYFTVCLAGSSEESRTDRALSAFDLSGRRGCQQVDAYQSTSNIIYRSGDFDTIEIHQHSSDLIISCVGSLGA
jgi:hypothetical protein